MAISRPARGSTARAVCSSVNGGGKVDHMGGSIVGLRLSMFRGNVRLSVQQKCHLSNQGSYQMSTAPVVRFAAALDTGPVLMVGLEPNGPLARVLAGQQLGRPGGPDVGGFSRDGQSGTRGTGISSSLLASTFVLQGPVDINPWWLGLVCPSCSTQGNISLYRWILCVVR